MVIFMDETYFKNRIPVIRRFDLPIFVNQLGYKPASIKRAVITKECSRFYIIDNDDKICFEGNVTHFGTDKDSQDDVYIADFSDFTKDCVIVSYDDFEYNFLENKGFRAEKIICLREYIRKTYPDLGRYIADAVIISLGLEEKLKEYISMPLFFGKSRLFYSLKVAVIFLSVIENFLTD